MLSPRSYSYLAVVTAATLFGFMPLLAKIVYAEGGDPISLCFYRFFLAVPLMLGLELREQRRQKSSTWSIFKLERVYWPALLLVSFFYAITPLLLFASYQYMDTSAASTLHFAYPLFVLLISLIFYRERLNLAKALALLCCLCGIILFYSPASNAGKSATLGLLLALASALTFALYLVFFAQSRLRELSRYKLCFYMLSLSSLILALVSSFTGSWQGSFSLKGWLVLLLFAVFISLAATLLLQYGIAQIGAVNGAILSTFEPLTSVLLAVLLLNEKLSLAALMGIVLILSSILLLARSEKKRLPPSHSNSGSSRGSA